MLKLLLIDDVGQKEFKAFILQQKQHIKIVLPVSKLPFNLNQKIMITVDSAVYVLNINDIMYCERKNNDTSRFYLNNKQSILVSKGFKDYEKKLEKSAFIRVHQTCLVNTNYIDSYKKNQRRALILKNGTSLPVAARKQEYLINQLEKL
jgi:two-component system LytT family response regulator